MRLAAIDIGTNSVHMIVVRVRPDFSFEVIDREKEMVRLGAGGLDGKRLTQEAMSSALQALSKFERLAKSHEVDQILAAATSATREAENGGAFLKAIERTTGIRPRIITGTTEARLIHLAAVYGVKPGTHGPTDISPVGQAAALHLDLAIHNFGIQEYMRHGDRTNEVFRQSFTFTDGHLHPGDEPGLGVELDEANVGARVGCDLQPRRDVGVVIEASADDLVLGSQIASDRAGDREDVGGRRRTEEALQSTGVPYIEKPFRVQELINIVERIFGKAE